MFKVLIPGILLFAGGSVFGQQTLTCSSDDMRRHYCGVDTRSGVDMIRQRSDAACRQGYSWGYDRRGIWVDHGCRADFVVGNRSAYGNNPYGYGSNNGYGYGRDGRYRDRDYDRNRDYGYRQRSNNGYGYGYGNGGYTNSLTCSSDDMRRHYCGANTAGGVQLLRQRSDAACREGYSWGYDRRGIWVDHGCRADFATR